MLSKASRKWDGNDGGKNSKCDWGQRSLAAMCKQKAQAKTWQMIMMINMKYEV